MSEIKTLKCDADGCHKMRLNDANHWWEGRVQGDMVSVAKLGTVSWDPLSTKHFCGEQCLLRWFVTELAGLKT